MIVKKIVRDEICMFIMVCVTPVILLARLVQVRDPIIAFNVKFHISIMMGFVAHHALLTNIKSIIQYVVVPETVPYVLQHLQRFVQPVLTLRTLFWMESVYLNVLHTLFRAQTHVLIVHQIAYLVLVVHHALTVELDTFFTNQDAILIVTHLACNTIKMGLHV